MPGVSAHVHTSPSCWDAQASLGSALLNSAVFRSFVSNSVRSGSVFASSLLSQRAQSPDRAVMGTGCPQERCPFCGGMECMVLPVAGGSSGQDTEVAVRTNVFPCGHFAAGRIPPTRRVGWGSSSSSESHTGVIHQSSSSRGMIPVWIIPKHSQGPLHDACMKALLQEAHERGQGSGFTVGNFRRAGGGRCRSVPGAETDVSVPWKGQGREKNRCLGSEECSLLSASNLICAGCM